MNRITKNQLSKFWMDEFVSPNHHCSLCGNSGIIDTRGVKTAAQWPAGRLNWCICPNGRVSRKGNDGELPTGKQLIESRL